MEPMRTDFRVFRPALLAALLSLTALPAIAQTAAKPAPKLQDRVLAVVDEDPILASDVERVIKLGLQQPQAGENDTQFRRRVLNALIEERLRFHEMDRFGFEQVPVTEIDTQVSAIRGRFPDEAAFQKALKEVGLDRKRLRQLVARQLLTYTYVDERRGPRVFVSLEDINRYYRDVLTPKMQQDKQPVPPLEEVRDQIREILRQQKLTEEIETWTEELRAEADIVVHNNPSTGAPLPPVVKRIETKKKEEGKKASGAKPPV
ncbi:MAG TPA: SurA N-terminal domain-containing protein [Thermoanaerobaculia bacterium]|nr:SurA N-terminal domain-containing protein [Thermoanaerobaculia bacterium]